MPKTLSVTKHFRLAMRLRDELAQVPAGTPVPTVSSLKDRFAVSQATVERALARLRADGLIERIPGELRLVVSQHADAVRCRLTLLRPEYPSPTFEEIARALIEAGNKRNWAFDLKYYRRLETLDVRELTTDTDGIILIPTSEPFPEHLLAALRRPGRPVIVVQDPPPDLRVSTIRMDDREIGALATRHLLELGHLHILMFLSEPTTPSGEARELGWRAAMTAAGLDGDGLDDLVLRTDIRPFMRSIDCAYDAFCAWLDRPHPAVTGIVCAAYTGAMAVLRALRERNIPVPGEISVVAHGGEHGIGAYLNPPLTAVETDLGQYGKHLVEMMERHLAGCLEPEHLMIASRLLLRGSTASPVGARSARARAER